MAGCGEPSRSASAVVANTTRGYHIFRIDGYSHTLATPHGEYLTSLPFTVGGHRWYIRYYPNGDRSKAKDYISLFLRLDDVNDSVPKKPVKALFDFRFVGDVAEQPLVLEKPSNFENHTGRGYPKFIKRADLEAKHLRDDSFAIRCDVVVVSNELRAVDILDATAAAATIPVPPSDLHQHLGSLLLNEKGADVVFDVAGETFTAHRCVLAARSPVFSAELFGAMRESDTGGVVHIEDMEPRVFKALLYFIYTDLFPRSEKKIKTKKMKLEEGDVGDDDEDILSQHLLVVADKYNLERLKLLCEKKLCEYVNAGNVATILALAEQHHCPGLKKVCFNFLSSPENLRTAVASDSFKHLSTSCPFVMVELFAMVGNLVP